VRQVVERYVQNQSGRHEHRPDDAEVGRAIDRIQNVGQMIKGNRRQTNLLALNAAIERREPESRDAVCRGGG